MVLTETLYCSATQCTKAVLPQPAGPCMSKPFGHCIPRLRPSASYKSGQPACRKHSSETIRKSCHKTQPEGSDHYLEYK